MNGLAMPKKLKYSIYPLARYAVSSSSDLCPAPEGLPSPEMIGNSVFMLTQSKDPPELVEVSLICAELCLMYCDVRCPCLDDEASA